MAKSSKSSECLNPRFTKTTNPMGLRKICRRGRNGFEVGIPDDWMKKVKMQAGMHVSVYYDIRDPKLLMMYAVTEEV